MKKNYVIAIRDYVTSNPGRVYGPYSEKRAKKILKKLDGGNKYLITVMKLTKPKVEEMLRNETNT
jgi:predicted house-cleaning NTP pyrophosphatase (Maf/HAM1 superfamily)